MACETSCVLDPSHFHVLPFSKDFRSCCSLVSQQVHSLFQSEFSKECALALPVSMSDILSFPSCHSVAAYSFSLSSCNFYPATVAGTISAPPWIKLWFFTPPCSLVVMFTDLPSSQYHVMIVFISKWVWFSVSSGVWTANSESAVILCCLVKSTSN